MRGNQAKYVEFRLWCDNDYTRSLPHTVRSVPLIVDSSNIKSVLGNLFAIKGDSYRRDILYINRL